MGHWIDLIAADGATISAWRAEPKGAPRGALVIDGGVGTSTT